MERHAFFTAPAAAMLLVAMGEMPSQFYVVLRWVVFAAFVGFVLLGSRAAQRRAAGFAAAEDWKDPDRIEVDLRAIRVWWRVGVPAAVLLLLVFNPIVPVYLHQRNDWSLIDLSTAGALALASTTVFNRRLSHSHNEFDMRSGIDSSLLVSPATWSVIAAFGAVLVMISLFLAFR